MRWWSTFPRKIGSPNQIVCQNAEEFQRQYEAMNGTADKVYVGLYSCDDEGAQDRVLLNLVALDIDDYARNFQTVLDLHEKYRSLGWKHQVMFSTGGFWIYIMCIPRIYSRYVAAGKLAAMQDSVLEGTSAFWGNAHTAPVDKAIRGDVRRITRMPTSYDRVRGRYAIFLTEEDLQKGTEHIVALSTTCDQQRRFLVHTFGETVGLDPEQFEAKRVSSPGMVQDLVETGSAFTLPAGLSETHKRILESIPDYLRPWVADPQRATWEARAFITLFLREKGFTKTQTESFLKPFYETHPRSDQWKNNWNHYINAAQTSEHMYRRTDLKFPNLKSLVEKGLISRVVAEKYGEFSSPAYR